MDYMIENNVKLFEELLLVLSRHMDEPGVGEAYADLRAARENYIQRSPDHMLNTLILAAYGLCVHPPSEELRNELIGVVSNFARKILDTPARLRKLADEYEKTGGKLLSNDEILREVEEMRGLSR